MLQTLLTKTAASQVLFSLNMHNVDELFPGFAPGDFAVLYGSPCIASMAFELCVRAQMPVQLGGINSNVIFIDGGNTFRRFHIARLAKLFHADEKRTLDNIHLSRAYTAYQMTNLIMEHLKNSVQRTHAKIVVISDITGLFLDQDLAEDEVRRIFSQITAYLQTFARENELIIIATCPQRPRDSRNVYLQALTCNKTNVVIGIQQALHDPEFNLEKHPHYMLGTAELPSKNLALTDFIY